MATHSSTLAWKIPQTEEPDGLQSMGSLRVRHDFTSLTSLISYFTTGEENGNPLQYSCNPTDCSTLPFPVLHYLLELTQTHVHWVSDTSNHLTLCRPLLLLPSIFPSIRVFRKSQLFTSGGQSIGVSASVLPKNIQDWFPLGLTGWISWQPKGLSMCLIQCDPLGPDMRHFWCAQFQNRETENDEYNLLSFLIKSQTGSWLWLRSWTPLFPNRDLKRKK